MGLAPLGGSGVTSAGGKAPLTPVAAELRGKKPTAAEVAVEENVG